MGPKSLDTMPVASKASCTTNQVTSPDCMCTTRDINGSDAQTLTGFLGSNVLPSEPTTDGWWSLHTGVSQASGYSLATGIHHSELPAVHGTATMMSLGRQVCGHTGLVLREKAKRHWYTRHPEKSPLHILRTFPAKLRVASEGNQMRGPTEQILENTSRLKINSVGKCKLTKMDLPQKS